MDRSISNKLLLVLKTNVDNLRPYILLPISQGDELVFKKGTIFGGNLVKPGALTTIIGRWKTCVSGRLGRCSCWTKECLRRTRYHLFCCGDRMDLPLRGPGPYMAASAGYGDSPDLPDSDLFPLDGLRLMSGRWGQCNTLTTTQHNRSTRLH